MFWLFTSINSILSKLLVVRFVNFCFVLVLFSDKMLHNTGLRLRECLGEIGGAIVCRFCFSFCFCFSSARKGTIFDKILYLIPYKLPASFHRRRLLRFRLFMFASSTICGMALYKLYFEVRILCC